MTPLATEIPEERSFKGQKKAQEIAEATTRLFQKSKHELYSSRRGETNHARLVAISLTRDLSGLKLSEIALIFKMNSYKSVGTSCYRLKARLAKEPTLKKQYERLVHACSQEEI